MYIIFEKLLFVFRVGPDQGRQAHSDTYIVSPLMVSIPAKELSLQRGDWQCRGE